MHSWVWRNWCDTKASGHGPVHRPERSDGRPEHRRCADLREPRRAIDRRRSRNGDEVREARTGAASRRTSSAKGSPPPIHYALINPKNGWLVSDGYTLVAVYAGSPGEDPSLGRFAIVRQNVIFGVQYDPPDIVDVGRVGAIKITRAPRGRSRETSAQTGRIAFVSANGTKGVPRPDGPIASAITHALTRASS